MADSNKSTHPSSDYGATQSKIKESIIQIDEGDPGLRRSQSVPFMGANEETDTRRRWFRGTSDIEYGHRNSDRTSEILDNSVVYIPRNENDIEAHRISNNYIFGFKKWKSHVTSRPLSNRSEIVQDLYMDVSQIKPVKVSTIRPTNIIYVILIGWWLALVYLLVAFLMGITIIGRAYALFCWRMAVYFIWPFGKYVHRIHPVDHSQMANGLSHYRNGSDTVETTGLLSRSQSTPRRCCDTGYWCCFQTIIWLLLGAPILMIFHFIVIFLSWLLVVSIPIAKVNIKTVTQIFWLPPDQVEVGDSSQTSMDPKRMRSEILMYTHQSCNIYYYKYTFDGMNIILVNLLVFVALSLALGYSDEENKVTDGVTKCVLAVLAIVPLTYYIGMAIISISAQSSFAIGAILNATFGSAVEVILYIVVLLKGRSENESCYAELVRSSLTGTIVGSILVIPGMCMVVGGLKYRSQNYNPKSASVTALLLFVAVGGVFAPTLFSKIYGDLQCDKCETNGTSLNVSYGLQCSNCHQSITGLDGDNSLYQTHIRPLVYACALILPIAYIIGVVFSLKTHTSYVYDEFNQQLAIDTQHHSGHNHGAPAWSRIKSIIYLLCCAVLIALCADLITNNIQALLEASGVSEYFIGVTMIAMIPELPEIINGIQFSLQNNVNLGIEIGTNTAIQVCLIQVPFLVLINLIFGLNFIPIFDDVHLWAVIFSVIVINYTFQDGKSDYFQGSALIFIYLLLMCMYFVTPTPESATC